MIRYFYADEDFRRNFPKDATEMPKEHEDAQAFYNALVKVVKSAFGGGNIFAGFDGDWIFTLLVESYVTIDELNPGNLSGQIDRLMRITGYNIDVNIVIDLRTDG